MKPTMADLTHAFLHYKLHLKGNYVLQQDSIFDNLKKNDQCKI